MKLVLLSDTHMHHRKLDMPDGDVLLHAGDISFSIQGTGGWGDLADFGDWLEGLDYPGGIVVVPGNHDFGFELDWTRAAQLMPAATVLCNSWTHVGDRLKVWGSPYTPYFCNWAFNSPPGDEKYLRRMWEEIPEDADIVLTHGPPRGILDRVFIEHVGCAALTENIHRVAPKVHAFGHVHIGRGHVRRGKTDYLNVSIVNERYEPVYKPIVWDILDEGLT